METEEEVDILMSSDVYSATLSTKSITFSRAQTGWLFREDKTVGARLGPRRLTCCAVGFQQAAAGKLMNFPRKADFR